MRDSIRRERCSNLNNELRAANIKLNAAINREADAQNTKLVGNGNISGYEYEITQINIQLAALEVGGFVGGRAIGIVSAGKIAQLKNRKDKIEGLISSTKRDIRDAEQILREVEQIQYIQRGLISQIENEKNNLGC